MTAPSPSGYRELPPPPALADYLACMWVSHTPPAGSDWQPRVLPDGCIDIVWVGDAEPQVAGPATRAEFPELPPDTPIVAARFKPGLAPCLLGWPAGELRDQAVPLSEIWRAELLVFARAASEPRSTLHRLKALESGLLQRLGDGTQPDPVIQEGVASLTRDANLRVRDLGRQVGMSERQLRRRFEAGVGYGPKMFGRVLRMQAALRSMREIPTDRLDLARIAYDTGYADQAHMTRELAALAGAPPTRLPELAR